MKNNIKIAIVHDFLTKIGGAEKVLQFVHQIFPDAPIFTLLYSKKGTSRMFENSSYTIISSYLNKYPDFLIRKPKLFLNKLSYAIEQFDLSKYDAVISLSNSFAHGVITRPETFHFTYCHSPMRYAWDWYHQYLEENEIGFGVIGLYIRKSLSQVRIWDKLASKRTDFWTANSINVAKRIKKYYQIDSKVIYRPVEIKNVKISPFRNNKYYLIISRLEPYKKIDLAIKAFNQNRRPLIVIGAGSCDNSLKEIAKENIKFIGWQSQNNLEEYIINAKALIFPGEEDFGLTPIEAMSFGRPVIALNKGGVKETVIDHETGVLFNNSSPQSLNEAIDCFESNINIIKPDKCRSHAKLYAKEIFLSDFKDTFFEEYDKYQQKLYEK